MMRINNKHFQALTALLAVALLLNGCIGLAESQETPPENPGDNPSSLAISTTSLPDGQVQSGYLASLAAEGGKKPYAWRVKSGQLPQGVVLNTTSGVLSGMPTKSGKFTVDFEVADADAKTAGKSLSMQISAASLAISTVTLPTGQVQSAYSAPVSATGGTTPHSWSVSTGSLPPGLALAASTGTISGTPTAHGSYAFTIRVQDAGSPQQVASQPLTISIFPAQLSVTTTSLPSGAVSTAFQCSLAATGGVAPYSWAVVQGALPPGLSLNASTGSISGTPSQAGNFSFTVYVSDAAQASATRALSITIETGVAPIAISTANLPNAQVQVAYSASLAATGGTPPYTWSISSGALPAGLSLNGTTGVISGTPTGATTTTFTVRVRDSGSPQQTITKQFSITVNPAALAISTSSLAAGQVGVSYSASVAATGGTTPYSWSISQGSLPAGLSLSSSSGAISGTPSAAGTSNFTVRVQDSNGTAATRQLAITVNPAALAISTSSLAAGQVGVSYSASVAATGGTTPYSWSLSQGSLPAGLSLSSSSGAISGTPSAAGTSNFTVRVQDSNGTAATRQLSITVNPAALAISTSSLAAGQVGVSYSASVAATGGTTPYSWSISQGSLPAGLSLNSSSGAISGTPSAAGTSNFTVRVQDSNGTAATRQLAITVNPAALAISTSSLAAGQVGVSYSASVAATGGTTPYSWSISQGSLPAGLSLNSSSGAISGTPSAAGTSNFTVRVQDSNGTAATRQLAITVNPAALAISTSSLAAGQVGVSYSASVAATGGTTPYSWSISQGSLPAGLSLNSSSGAISGTPSAAGTSNFTVRVQDSNGTAATRQLSITVNPAALAISTSSLAAGQVGVSYSASVAATGGTTPYSWSISQGSLPAGLSLNSSSGAISGTPSAAGTSNFTVRVQDSNGTAATRQLAITVNPAALAISTSSLAAGQVGVSYSASVAATGGTTPYSWSLSQGSLPAGLSLNSSSGAISGTPSASGTSNFTVRVQDSNGTAATRQLSITVNPAALAISTSSLAAGQVGVSYSASVAATGGTTPYSWSLSQGSLPAGLSLNASSGAISGTPSAAGTSNFTVRVQDSNGTAATKQLSIAIAAAATSGPAPGSGDTIILSDGFEGGNLSSWDSNHSRYTVDTAQARTGSRSVRVLSNGSTTSGTLDKWFMPGVDEVYVRYYLYPASTLNLPEMHLAALMGNRTDDRWSASGKAGIKPNGTDFFHAVIDTTADRIPVFYTYWPDMQCPASGGCYGNVIPQNSPAIALVRGQWNEVVHRIRLNTPGQKDGLQEMWVNGEKKISQTGMRWRDSDILRLNQFRFEFFTSYSVSGTQYVWVDDVAVWAPAGSEPAPSSDTPALTVSPTSLSFSATQGSVPGCKSVQIQNSGTGTMSWSAQASWTGFTLSPSSGTAPSTMQVCINSALDGSVGTYSDTLTITASGAQGSPKTIPITTTITQAVAALSVYNTSLPGGTVGSSYSATLQAGGGVSPYSWSISQGSLPAGLSLNSSSGAISGTPSVAGSSTFTVRVQDGLGTAATQQLSITVVNASSTPQVTTSSLPGGTVGSSYSATLTASGGSTPYSWSLASGSLPAGLSLNSSTGAISGTPSSAGTSSFTVRVTDALAQTATRSLSIAIQSSSQQLLFQSDFSDGFAKFAATTGNVSQASSGCRSGTKCAAITFNSAEQGGFAESAHSGNGIPAGSYYRACYKFPTNFFQNATFYKAMILYPTNYQGTAYVNFNHSDGWIEFLSLVDDTWRGAGVRFPADNQWHCLSVQLSWGNSGRVRMWLDDKQILDVADRVFTSNPSGVGTVKWGAYSNANLGGRTLYLDDLSISANFFSDGGALQESQRSVEASESAAATLVEDDFESASMTAWAASRLLVTSEQAASGRYSVRADHLAGSTGGDSAEAYFADYLNQDAPANDLQVEFDVYLDANLDVRPSGSDSPCATTLARLLANDDGQPLYGEPLPFAPYLLTLCLNEQLEPQFELLRRTGSNGRQTLAPNRAAVRFRAGGWHKVAYRARLNSAGRADGLLELWVNGQLVAQYDNVNFRDSYSGKGWNMFQLAGQDAAPSSRTWFQYWDNVRVLRVQ